MKRIVMLMIIIVLLKNYCIGFAEEQNDISEAVNERSTVAKLVYTVQFDGYEREGLYTGEIVNGIPDGYGVFVTHNKKGIEWHYIGEWEKGTFNGNGAQYWENGEFTKGTFKDNSILNGAACWNSTLTTMWLNEYDESGNRHFITYYPGSLEQKYCEGYAEVSSEEVITVTWFDEEGQKIDSPKPLTITAIAYLK